MIQTEKEGYSKKTSRKVVNGLGILTITSGLLAGYCLSTKFENAAHKKHAKELEGSGRSSQTDSEIQEENTGLLSYETERLNIGSPVRASFEQAEPDTDAALDKEIRRFAGLELSKIFEVPLSDFDKSFKVDISYLNLVGTEGQAEVPFVTVTPLESKESFNFMFMDISEDNKLKVPDKDGSSVLTGHVLIPLDRVTSPYNDINTLDALGSEGNRQTVIRYSEGSGWYFVSPFKDFVAPQDLLIDYNSLKDGCVLFGC